MLRCCWSESSVSEELRRVSAATLEGGGRATTDARGVETGRAGARPGDAMQDGTIDTEVSAPVSVVMLLFGWEILYRASPGGSIGVG